MQFNNKTILISGIGDFIGLRATFMAIELGMQVRGLEVSPEKAKKAQELGAKVIVGSVNDEKALDCACDGVDIVLHTAAVNEPGADPDLYRKINVEGTVNIAQAAKKNGVKTFVHLSSAIVYGFKFPDRVTEIYSLVNEKNALCQSKIESETEVLKFNNPSNFGVIVIRAGDIYGPGAIAWVVRPLQLMQKKKFVLVDGGKGICNHVFVDNLIDAIFLAIEKETYGEIFNITDGCFTTWKEYYTRLASISGYAKPSTSVPALIAKTAIRQMGKNAEISPDSIDFVTRKNTYSIDKARRVLGYEPRVNLNEGMILTAKWLQNKLSDRLLIEI